MVRIFLYFGNENLKMKQIIEMSIALQCYECDSQKTFLFGDGCDYDPFDTVASKFEHVCNVGFPVCCKIGTFYYIFLKNTPESFINLLRLSVTRTVSGGTRVSRDCCKPDICDSVVDEHNDQILSCFTCRKPLCNATNATKFEPMKLIAFISLAISAIKFNSNY